LKKKIDFDFLYYKSFSVTNIWSS